MRRSHPARLATLLAGLVVTAGLVTVSAPGAAYGLDAPTNLRASDAANPVLSWDRVSGATGYDVELSRTAEFTSGTRIGSVVSTTNVQYVPTGQLPQSTIHWRVRAKGSETSTYATGTFTPGATPAPRMLRPQADTHFQAPEAPYFTWEPVPGATSYTVEVGPDPQFVDTTVPGYAARKQKTTAAYLTGYQTSGTYYWRVQAELTTGFLTEWTPSRRYHVDGLPAVVRTAPADDFGPAVRDVVLDWEPVPGAASYQLQVSTDGGFLTTVSGGNVSNIVATQWSPTATLPNDEYYWRVRAVDASGNAAPWPDTPFTFRRAWPHQPELVHPVGAIDSAQPFFFEWTAIERASKYTVYLYDAADPAEPICSSTTVHTTFAPSESGGCGPSATGDYLWQVRATDEGGSAAPVTDLISQTAASFHYERPAPVTPGTGYTTDSVTGHATSITGTAAFTSDEGRDVCTAAIPATCVDLRQTPTLSWDPVPGATSYRLTLAYDRELTNRVSGFSGLTVSQPMYTFTKTLPDSQAGSAYYWVVQPCGVTCAPIAHARHSFAKKSIAPVPLSPAEGALVSDDVTIDWSSELEALRAPGADAGSSLHTPAATEARTYTLQMSTTPTFASTIESVPNVDETTYTSPTTTYPEGFVYWRVRANDGSNNPTVWSEVRKFEKRSPTPSLLTPANGAALGADYTLSWEPLPFAASYDIEVYAAGSTNAVDANTRHASWAPSDPFPVSTGNYTWRVRRVDAKGLKGEWSPTWSFRMDGFPVSPAAPAAGALVPPTGGLFSWLPDPRATSYKFERRKPNDPTNALAESVTTRATAWAPTSAMAAGTAQWRVIALDAAGKDLGSSPWRDFVVVDPPAVATPVTISGSGKVGSELRVAAPTFDPAAEATTYQWYRGSSRITGATGPTYTVVSGDYGKALSVEATGTLTGYKSATSRSNEIVGVDGDALVALQPPRIEGDAYVGRTLTAAAGTWPESPSVTRQWHRDGVPISGATRTTYTLVAADLGRTITHVETARKTGYADGTATSVPVTPEAPPPLVATRRPAIQGEPYLGRTLTAVAGAWPESPSVSRQWHRDGVPISGATRTTYALTSADLGHDVTVVETARKSAWSDGTSSSAGVTVLAPPRITVVTRPTVTGSPRVGGQLEAGTGSWTAGSPSFAYQWFRNGVAIAGATRSSYTPVAADAARRVHVVVTATASGYSPGSAPSAARSIAKMTSSTTLSLSSTRTTTKKPVTASVRVSVSGLSRPGGTVTFYDGSRRLKTVALSSSGTATYKLPKLKKGKHTIKAVYSGSAQVTGSQRTATVTVTKAKRKR